MFWQRVISRKRAELALKKNLFSLSELRRRIRDLPPTREFYNSISQNKPIALIAEIKRASPSAGWINKDADILNIAREYELGGAAAISVLTEASFFQGTTHDLRLLRKSISLPLLQKDFIFDSFQIYEGRNLGADAVLLIAKILDHQQLRELIELTHELGMGFLLEVHDEEDVQKISGLTIPILGINNRNLDDLSVNLETTFSLLKKISGDSLIISESGIKNRGDVISLTQAGVRGILVGEVLMRSLHPALKIKELLGR